MDHPNKGNTHASKPDEQRAEAFLHVRCKASDKARWLRAAKGQKLAQWVIKTLNDAAE